MKIQKVGFQSFLLAGFFLLVFSQSLLAAPVTLKVLNSSDSGFGFSEVHEATSSGSINGVTYYWNGAAVLGGPPTGLHGVLLADLSGGNLTGITGTLTGAQGSLDISGGYFTETAGQSDALIGELDFTLKDLAAQTLETGTFYFINRNFTGGSIPPNTFDGTFLSLWGNNWDNPRGGDPGVGNRFGLDLRVQVVPIPGALLLFGTGLIGLVGIARREILANFIKGK